MAGGERLNRTQHRVFAKSSVSMGELAEGSIDLVVTSPPYPMIAMWDGLFSGINPEIGVLLEEDAGAAHELMHKELDKTWAELRRVVKGGGTVCINIGDAARAVGDDFSVYPNHARVVSKMAELGFSVLPGIIWRKPTNAPNKFMGSGMLPAGAYVTLEHEHILLFRKGGKRAFSEEEKALRRESAYFWEERNEWFSDIWELGGRRQMVDAGSARRSAAYPLELPRRLILMFSIYGDTVLDPFLGTGTTMRAAMALGRNSAGYELDGSLAELSKRGALDGIEGCRGMGEARLCRHAAFVKSRAESGKEVKYTNERYGFPVVTSHERGIVLYRPSDARERSDGVIEVGYRAIVEGGGLPSGRPRGDDAVTARTANIL